LKLLLAFFNDEVFCKTFSASPAAMQYHHAYLGGLLEHILSVAKLAISFAGHYPVIKRDLLITGVILHDIGKIGISDSILLKKAGLTDEEYETMKAHVSIGKEVMQKVIEEFKSNQSFFIVARNICEYHHEKYDGTGYLRGLKEEEIPLEARIFALCDAYDAIRSERPYKGPLPHKEAVLRISSDSGKHFDPVVVDAFLRCEKEFEKVSKSFSLKAN